MKDFPIPHTEQHIIRVDCSDLDRFISTEYGIDFECIPDQEWGNYQDHIIELCQEQLSEYRQKDLEEWKASNGKKGSYLLRTILTDLCNRERLPLCTLSIHCFW